MGLSLLFCNRHKQCSAGSSVHHPQALYTHMCPCVRCEHMWQLAKALSMHSLWMTVGFSELHPYVGFLRSYNCFLLYIAPCSAGKAADMSAPESSHSRAREGWNTADTTLCSILSVQGWKGEKHAPAEGNNIMLKGLFWEGHVREGNTNTFEKW